MILKPSSNRSPYIFTLVQKVKIEHTYFMLDDIRENVPSFQNVILFLRYEIVINLRFGCLKMLLTTMI